MEERQKHNSEKDAIFKPVIQYMTKNINKSLKTEDLASLMYMQPTYFIRCFKKQYGMPPITYFNRMKIYKAMGLLAGTDLTIEEISGEIGIFDTSYFARLFKKHCDISPTRYRAKFKKM